MRIVLDAEANGFLPMASAIHVIVARSIDDPTITWSFRTKPTFEEFLLSTPITMVVGHNIIGYDLPLFRQVWGIPYGVSPRGDFLGDRECEIVDTFQLSQFINPDRVGGHGLDNLAKLAGTFKMDYKEGFEEYSELMHDYCRQDTLASVKVFEYLIRETEAKYG